MTPDQAAEILRLREAQLAPKQIARQLGLRPAEVTAFIRDHAEEAYLEKARSGNLLPLQECRVNQGAVQNLLRPQKAGLFSKLTNRNQDDGVGGLCEVVVARQDHNRLLVGSYLVDYWCLGVKDAMGPRKMGRSEYQLYLKSNEDRFEQPFVDITLDQAQAIVYGAVDYARSIGLEPNRAFNTKVQAHLGSRPETLLPLEFGKDGQPFFISGPYDNAEKIIKTLQATVGEGNFHYLAAIGGSGMMDGDFFL
ncbi:MAG TPA: DNA-binding response regulator [Leptolyngbyaceae cyanobacterium M65_K2018_010]|nr:DNA-binding response regulator [Leptolyngbyaceae cyanobacterium M65_K2018_010]